VPAFIISPSLLSTSVFLPTFRQSISQSVKLTVNTSGS